VIRRALIGGFAAALVLIALRAGAMTAEEHASHHPSGGADHPARPKWLRARRRLHLPHPPASQEWLPALQPRHRLLRDQVLRVG
jgi:hypothetical protein